MQVVFIHDLETMSSSYVLFFLLDFAWLMQLNPLTSDC